jgi:N-acetylmuramic acid 6-phosphate etherase/N-acetylglucosamine-6-phosphate deacetylase
MDSNDIEFLEQLGTEQVRPELANLDQLSIEDLVDVMCADVRQLPNSLAAAQHQIAEAVRGIVDRLERGGRLIYVGAGTAGRLGMLDAAEAGPTFNVDAGMVIGVLAGGMNAFGVPIENAEDDHDGGRLAMADINVVEVDCVVGISASGRTPYVLGAIARAQEVGTLTVGIACNVGTPLGANVDLPIEVEVGPELIAGSTRLNSGTVQKIVLNVISTATMVRLGKTYGNLMVDLRPTNEKLRDRSARIVAHITDVSLEQARQALEASGWQTKVATAMIVGQLDAEEARRRLALYEGRLRPTLDSLRGPAASASLSHGGWTRLGVAAAFVDGELIEGDVAVSDGLVVAVGLSRPGRGIAIPGYVDAQLNGYAGVDLLNASVDDIVEMTRALMRDGVIAFQPTLITSAFEETQRAAENLAKARSLVTDGARILGVHLEGPFLSSLRAGTHPPRHLRAPDPELLQRLLDLEGVTMMTLAPELPGALALIEQCRRRGVTVSLGHSAATSGEADLAFDAGASAVTHLFNAMDSLSARSPGLAGVALPRPGVTIQLINDGVHVDDHMVALAFASAPNRCIVVTDAIAATGSIDSTVQLGEVTVTVVDGIARRDDGTIAGSIGKLRESVVRLTGQGVSRAEALRAVISRPAELLGFSSNVSLAPGSSDSLFIVDDDLNLVSRVSSGVITDV